jgi:hypothetical protein
MLGYVLALPVQDVVSAIDNRLQKTYGTAAKPTPVSSDKFVRFAETGRRDFLREDRRQWLAESQPA